MGFLTPEPINRPHYCERPVPYWIAEGTRWQCDDCAAIYRLEPVTDRNITALEWVLQAFKAADLLLPRGTEAPPPTGTELGPDCRDAKHRACDGRSYNLDTDQIVHCPCICHATKEKE